VAIVCIGVDHTSAPIALRERLACSLRQIPQVLRAARSVAQECVLLSTCNRFELYAVVPDATDGLARLHALLSREREVDLVELAAHTYSRVDEAAVVHLLGVASGLYSQVLGEPQIQGQVSDALEVALGGGFAGPITSALFRAALVAGKRARSETGISRNPASISLVAVQLARKLFPNLNEASVLLVGSGKMSELAAQNLCANGVQHLTIISRKLEHAVDLAERVGARHRTFAELATALGEVDVVLTSTTAPHALLTLTMLRDVMAQRAVSELKDVYLYNLDDLQAVVDEGLRLRTQESPQVEAIIAEESAAFERWLKSLSVVGTISDLRRHVDTLREQELTRTLNQLSHSLSERETAAIQELSTRLMNKILHIPTRRLKDAAAEGREQQIAEAVRYLFALETVHEETHHYRHQRQQAGLDSDELDRSTAPTARSGD
jgi:glutamyl-tRNA reductase